jgi:hypothetical protein
MERALRDELASLLNRHSAENRSNTPDFILAQFMMNCLQAYNEAVLDRADWYGRMDAPGQASASPGPTPGFSPPAYSPNPLA